MEEEEILSVFTAEVIKVVRAGSDKEQSELGDVLRRIRIHRKEFASS